MPISWEKHSISISKRWADTFQESPQTEPSTETGTRYFLHVTFPILFLLQITNAGIQQWEAPLYFVYISLLYGPVLLFNLWVAQGFQEIMAKKFFQLRETSFDAVLSTMGGLTTHRTSTVAQDVKVSSMLPWAYSMLGLFWLGWYAVLDFAAFDNTITHGVDYGELNTIRGICANVSAQAVYINLYLVALHIIVPVFPLSGASFFAACLAGQGLGVRKTALIMDLFGTLVSVLLLFVGAQQTFFHDKNGIGVFILFNALVLCTLCFKRRFVDPLESHDLVCRPCYNEKEDISSTEEKAKDSPDATDSSDDLVVEDLVENEIV